MSTRSVVLGSASSLSADHFLPFLRSLAETDFAGRVCVFVTQMDESEIARINDEANLVVRLDSAYPEVVPRPAVAALWKVKTTKGLRRFYPAAYRATGRMLGARMGSGRARDLEYRLQGLQALRYRHYLDFLSAEPDVDQVMISDLRDVIFQSDPFATPMAPLEVFLEEPSVRVGDPGFNSTWMRDLYGAGGLSRLRGAVVSCSGVTVGTREGMMRYLAAMAEEVERHTFPLGPHDQGIHNWLLHTGQLPGATQVPNGSGRVQTMGAQGVIYLAPDGTVLNPDGACPAVIHQYDRHPGLAQRLFQRYGVAA